MSRRETALAAGTAWVGLVVGHFLTYALAYPSDQGRHLHLAVTGHGWLGLAALSIAFVVPIVLVLAGVRSVRGAGVPIARTAGRLTIVQVSAFALIELVERHVSLPATVSDPVVLWGLLLQVLVAFAAAIVLSAFSKAVRTVAARIRRRLRPSRSRPVPPPRAVPARTLDFLVRARRRAPPLPLSS